MRIIYTPKDNPDGREEFAADLEDLWVGEVKLLEKATGSTFQEIGEMLERGSATYLLALVWIYRRRQHRDLELNDMDDIMRLSELDIQADEAEADEDEVSLVAPKDVPDLSPESTADANDSAA